MIRKKYFIYPPGYQSDGNFQVRYSRLQAWKLAKKLGDGTEVDVSMTFLKCKPHKGMNTTGFSGYPLWEIRYVD